MAVAILIVTSGACVFELGEVVDASAGGGGAGGAVNTGGQGGTVEPMRQRTRIEIDASALVTSHDDFPVLVVVDATSIDYAQAGTNGAGVRFYAEDGTTLLAHEIEQWSVGGASTLWVKLPTVTAGVNAIWMVVGDVDAPTPLPTEDTWSAYVAVYHLGDTADSSATGLDGTGVSLSNAVVPGRFGDAHRFEAVSGATPHIDLGDDTLFHVPPGGVRTAEIWFQRSSPFDNAGFMMGLEGCCVGWGFQWLGADLLRAQVGATTCCPGTGNYSYAQPPFQDPNFDWYHAVMVMDRGAGTNTLYIDGVVADSQPIPDDGSSMQGALHIGSNFEGTNGFDGTLDEMRISTRGLPADWIVLQHAVMTGAVVSVMEPEAF